MKQVANRDLKIEAMYFSEISVGFNGQHGCIFQKINLFITTAVRASAPTYKYLCSDAKCKWKYAKLPGGFETLY
jgi:hypothetical protein